jgi:TatD DNase family protein
MKLTDTHIHLYAEDYNSDRDTLIRRAKAAGVETFLLPNIDQDSLTEMWDLCNLHSESCFAMVGLHPCYVNAGYKSQLEDIHANLIMNRDRVIAIGEIGLDYHWDLTFKMEQIEAFKIQVSWAAELGLPISIHSRNSTQEIIDILRELNLKELTGVFHCFSGDINQADEIINMGFYLGIGGVVTFKNSELSEIVNQVPLERIVLETDGPYLAPTPFRGKRNEPAYLKLIAEKVAEIKKITLDEVASVTTTNALNIFTLKLNN